MYNVQFLRIKSRGCLLIALALCGNALAQATLNGSGTGLSSVPLYTRLSPTGGPDLRLLANLRIAPASPTLSVLAREASAAPRLEPEARLSYSLVPQRLGVHSAVRLGSGRDARGAAVELGLSSQFALTETTHLGLSASSVWLNGSASQQWMGDLTGSPAAYTVQTPSYGLRDLRAGVSLSGPLPDRWSYSAGANLGRLSGDPRMTSLLPNGNAGSSGRTGLVFFNARYAF